MAQVMSKLSPTLDNKAARHTVPTTTTTRKKATTIPGTTTITSENQKTNTSITKDQAIKALTATVTTMVDVPAVFTEVTADCMFLSWPTTTPNRLIMAAAGKSRAVPVTELTELAKNLGLNIDNGMAHKIDDTFGMMLVVSGKPEKVREFETQVATIRERVRTTVKTTTTRTTVDVKVITRPDRPGVVYDLNCLATECGMEPVALAVRTCRVLTPDADLLDGAEDSPETKIGVTQLRLAYTTLTQLTTFEERIQTLPGYDSWEVRIDPTKTTTP